MDYQFEWTTNHIYLRTHASICICVHAFLYETVQVQQSEAEGRPQCSLT